MRKYRILITSTLLFLIPIIILVLNYNELPDEVGIHFGIDGEVDRYGSKESLIYILLGMIAINTIILFISIKYYGDSVKSKFLEALSFVIPAIASTIMYVTVKNGLGMEVDVIKITLGLIGFILILLGNYMGKLEPNKIAGIRLKVTLNDRDVWRRTHRFAGKVFVVCGALILLTMPLSNIYIGIALAFVAAIASFSYPYTISKERGK